MSSPLAIRDWLATRPLFGGEVPDFEQLSHGPGADLYRLKWANEHAVLKLYKSTLTPTRKANDKRRAEATALALYAPKGLAPELLWEGELPEPAGDALIYNWAEGK